MAKRPSLARNKRSKEARWQLGRNKEQVERAISHPVAVGGASSLETRGMAERDRAYYTGEVTGHQRCAIRHAETHRDNPGLSKTERRPQRRPEQSSGGHPPQ